MLLFFLFFFLMLVLRDKRVERLHTNKPSGEIVHASRKYLDNMVQKVFSF